MTPVVHLVSYHFGVEHNDHDVIVSFRFTGAGANLCHFPNGLSYNYNIAFFYGPFL